MQAHPHLDLDSVRPPVLRQRTLCVGGARYRVSRAHEGEEEGIALRVDLAALRTTEHLAQDLPLLP